LGDHRNTKLSKKWHMDLSRVCTTWCSCFKGCLLLSRQPV